MIHVPISQTEKLRPREDTAFLGPCSKYQTRSREGCKGSSPCTSQAPSSPSEAPSPAEGGTGTTGCPQCHPMHGQRRQPHAPTEATGPSLRQRSHPRGLREDPRRSREGDGYRRPSERRARRRARRDLRALLGLRLPQRGPPSHSRDRRRREAHPPNWTGKQLTKGLRNSTTEPKKRERELCSGRHSNSQAGAAATDFHFPFLPPRPQWPWWPWWSSLPTAWQVPPGTSHTAVAWVHHRLPDGHQEVEAQLPIPRCHHPRTHGSCPHPGSAPPHVLL